ncbi:MAG: class 1 fructose-bisphosphatase [Haloarculaceae archaeon]
MSVEAVLETVAATAPDVRAALPGRRRKTDEENPSGETQLAADVYADGLFEERLLALDSVASYASEEREAVVHADGGGGTYHLAVDPLDGSSNLRSNNPMGTIVGVYDAPLPTSGRNLVAAAYVLYGPITTMVAAVDGEVTEYVVEGGADASDAASGAGARRAVREDVTLPDDPVVYGFGGRVPDWPDEFAAYVEAVEQELKLRYGGAMVADVSQVVTYGGIFAYPGLEDRPEGKLRLLFEGTPIGYIVESAGGASSDGEQSLLDVEATALHQRVPVHVGNEEYVERLEAALA